MRSLKILFPVHVFFPSHFYGTETYTLQLAREMRALGHAPVILTATPPGESGTGVLHATYHYDGLPVHCIDLNRMPPRQWRDTYFRPEMAPLLAGILDQVRPDIVHVTHLINHTAVLLDVAARKQIPLVATLTDFFGLCHNHKLERFDGRLCLGPGPGAINCLCCRAARIHPARARQVLGPLVRSPNAMRVGAALLPALLDHGPLRHRPVAVNGRAVRQRFGIMKARYGHYRRMIAPTDFLMEAYVNNDVYPERITKLNFGIALDQPAAVYQPRVKSDTGVTFGYVGQLMPHKGVDLLVDAFLGLKGEGLSLVIYGPVTQNSNYYRRLSRRVAGDPRVRFAPTFPSTELAARLRALDVLVIPSRWYENSPLVLLYALATRTPVIVSDVRGMNEFVRSDHNGYCFAMGSAADLRAQMQRVADQPASIARLSRNARYTNSVADHARRVLDIYDQVRDR